MTTDMNHPANSASDQPGLLSDAIESMSEGIAVYGKDRRLVASNAQYAKINKLVADLIVPGVLWDDLLRAAVYRGQFPEAVGREEDWLQEHMQQETRFEQGIELQHSDGRRYVSSFRPTRQGGFVVTRTDITARREAEAAARDTETLLRTVLDTTPIAIIMARLSDGKILYRSLAALEKFGEVEQAQDFFTSAEARQAYIDMLHPTGRVDDARLELVDGEGRHFTSSASGRLTNYLGDTVVVTANTDLTERMEREEVIRHVLEACPTPIQMTKAVTGEVLFTSPETISLFGKFDSSKSFYVDPGARDAYLEILRAAGSVSEYKVRLYNAAREPFWAAVSARLIQFDGEEVIVSHTRDLTRQLAVEEELAEQRELLFQNEKMSALGELLAGVAHELNNPLSVVVGHSLMLQEEATDAEVLRQTAKISKAAERCAKIVKTFLTMARQQPSKVERTCINSVIRTAIDVTSYGDATANLRVESDLADGLPHISADPDQLTQVLVNLILNAEQAMQSAGTGSTVSISTRQAKAPDMIEIRVEDDGPGVPADISGRLFEPFFTTKEVGQGTGIGLTLCHRIIRSHNGQIWLDDATEQGARFRIHLPVNTSAEAEAPVPETREEPRASASVLVVDDEADVAELTAEILRREGYSVDVAHSPVTALKHMAARPYDVVLSDLNMPELGGRGFYEAIARDFPELKTATGFITGDTMGSTSQKFLKESQRPFLEKPVSPTELRAFVTDILQSRETK